MSTKRQHARQARTHTIRQLVRDATDQALDGEIDTDGSFADPAGYRAALLEARAKLDEAIKLLATTEPAR